MAPNLGQVVLVKDINPGVFKGSNLPIDSQSGEQVYSPAENSTEVLTDESIDLDSGKNEADQSDLISPPYYSSTPTSNNSYPQSLIEFSDRLYFSADNGVNGRELYVSDGTAQGTQLVTDIYPGSNDDGYIYNSAPYNLIEFKDKIYFSANDGESGNELYVSDGTAQGTQLVADIYPGEDKYGNLRSSSPSNLLEFKDKIYFTANDGKNGNELYVSDGTAEGTQLVADINPGEDKYGNLRSSSPSNLLEFKDKIYFTANDGKNGNELYVSDGTAQGTQLVADIFSGEDDYGNPGGSYLGNLIEFKDKIYFTANDGKNGSELYVSDGTAEGTQLFADISPGKDNYGSIRGSYPSNLIEFKDKIYFTANDGKSGSELYVSDGTAEGTQLVADISPGEDDYGNPNDSYPSSLVEFNGKLYFSANNGESGSELYVSDGTAEGTQLVADISPGEDNYGNPKSSYLSNLTVVGDELFFTANDGNSGNELFKLTFDDVIEPARIEIKGTNGADNLLGSNNAENIKAFSGEDNVASGGGDDTVAGGNGDDRLIGNNGNDRLIGGNGNDTLSGGESDDALLGKKGKDVLDAGSGDDLLKGGEDNDLLKGNFGADILNGGNGEDRLIGGSGDDLLKGGNGNDHFDGSMGLDTLRGGNGEDVFVLRSDAGMDTIQNFDLESDRLSLDRGLQFDDLSFNDNQILKGKEVLATLTQINTEQLTEMNFSEI